MRYLLHNIQAIQVERCRDMIHIMNLLAGVVVNVKKKKKTPVWLFKTIVMFFMSLLPVLSFLTIFLCNFVFCIQKIFKTILIITSEIIYFVKLSLYTCNITLTLSSNTRGQRLLQPSAGHPPPFFSRLFSHINSLINFGKQVPNIKKVDVPFHNYEYKTRELNFMLFRCQIQLVFFFFFFFPCFGSIYQHFSFSSSFQSPPPFFPVTNGPINKYCIA